MFEKEPCRCCAETDRPWGRRGGRLWLRRQWQRWRAAVRALIFLAGKSSGISWLSSQERKYLSRVFKGEEMLTRQKRGGGKSWHDRWHGGWKGPANSDAARNRLTGAEAPEGALGRPQAGAVVGGLVGCAGFAFRGKRDPANWTEQGATSRTESREPKCPGPGAHAGNTHRGRVQTAGGRR